MRFFIMFVTAVCVLFLIKLQYAKKKKFYDTDLLSGVPLQNNACTAGYLLRCSTSKVHSRNFHGTFYGTELKTMSQEIMCCLSPSPRGIGLSLVVSQVFHLRQLQCSIALSLFVRESVLHELEIRQPCLRSKRFRGVGEQRKTKERYFSYFARAKLGREPKSPLSFCHAVILCP